MTKDTFKTDVIFRKEKDGSILALFPHLLWNYAGDVTCYAHLGQHSAADYSGCIRQSKPAKPEEYKDLLNELQGLGYDLRIIKRQSGRKYREAYLSIKSNN